NYINKINDVVKFKNIIDGHLACLKDKFKKQFDLNDDMNKIKDTLRMTILPIVISYNDSNYTHVTFANKLRINDTHVYKTITEYTNIYEMMSRLRSLVKLFGVKFFIKHDIKIISSHDFEYLSYKDKTDYYSTVLAQVINIIKSVHNTIVDYCSTMEYLNNISDIIDESNNILSSEDDSNTTIVNFFPDIDYSDSIELFNCADDFGSTDDHKSVADTDSIDMSEIS
ncbi:MAG: hypothetical protein Faunusvirus27_1, partial [Faunusvirus sp.]